MLDAAFVCGISTGCLGDPCDLRLLLGIWQQLMPIVIDPDLREVGRKQAPLHRVRDGRIERAGLLEQVQVPEQGVGFLPDDICRGRQPLCQRRSLDLQLAQSFPYLARRQGSVGREIEEAFLFHFEGGQLLLHPRMGLTLGAEPLIEAGCHLLTHRGDLRRRQPQPFHRVQDRIFDERDREMRQVAGMILSADAQKIGIDLTLAVDDLGVDELTVPSVGMAASAPQHRPQEVVVHDVALVALHPHIEHVLHPLEKLRRHEGGVFTGIDLALIGHHAQVVGIAEDGAKLAPRDHFLVPPGGTTGGEPLLGEFLLQAGEAVLTRGILLESPPHQWRPLRIDVDGIDQVTIDILPHIEVADLGATGGAAVLGFVEHLVADVLAALADLDLVHDVGDGFHGVGHVPLTEFFLGGDELDVHAGEDALGDGGIGLVPEDAGTHVDDDIANLRVFLDVMEEVAEDRTLGDGLRGLPRLDELFRDRGLEASGPLHRRLALGGDGVAVRIDVDRGMELALRGDPQIEDRRPCTGCSLIARCFGGVEPQQAVKARE